MGVLLAAFHFQFVSSRRAALPNPPRGAPEISAERSHALREVPMYDHDPA